MRTATFTSASPDETAQLARSFAGRLRPGDLVLLRGPLGSGKSHFARALIPAVTGEPDLDVPSPTYNLVLNYGPGPRGPGVSHADLYRLSQPHDMDELALEEALAGGLLVVEWPDIAEAELKALAGRVLDIRFRLPGAGEPETRRTLDISANSPGLLPPGLEKSRIS